MVGCDAVTATYEILESIMKHPMTDKGVMDYEKDSKKLYDI